MTSCHDDDTGPALLETEGMSNLMIDTRFDDADFELVEAFQTSSSDIAYTFSRLRYWVANVALIDENGDGHDRAGASIENGRSVSCMNADLIRSMRFWIITQME